MSDKQLLMLTRQEVRRTLDWASLLTACRSALIDVASEHPLPAISQQLPVPGASLHLKAGAVLQPPTISVKANLRPDGGSADGVIVVFDHVEHRVSAILASTDLTAMRTAAVAALAYERLSRVAHPTVAIVGAGPLGRYTIEVLREQYGVADFRVWSRHRDHAEQLAGDGVQVCDSIHDAVQSADVIVTCTPAREALIDLDLLTEHALVLAMGADSPGKRELADGVLAASTVYADVPKDARAVGELCWVDADTAARVTALGTLLQDPAHAVPTSGRIVFDSVGSSTVDAAVVAMALVRAAELGLGTPFDLDR